MTLDMPNYMNSEDRRLYNELIEKGLNNITSEEDMFFKEMYRQEIYICGQSKIIKEQTNEK